MITNDYIFEPISQTPDSVVVNSTQQPDTISTNSQGNSDKGEESSFGFSLERKTLISTESADTVADSKPLPQTLRQYNFVKKVDTLKFERYFFTHLQETSSFDNKLIIDVIPSYKTKKKSTEKIDKFLKKQEISIPKKDKETTKQVRATESKIEISKQKKEKKQSEIILVEPKKIQIKTTTNFMIGDWIIGVILFAAFIFAWVRMFYNRNYQDIIKSGFSYLQANKYIKESNSTTFRVSTFLNLVFFINISTFILLNLKFFSIQINLAEWKLYISIFIILLFTYTGKSLINNVLGYVFKSKTEAKEYILNVWLYNKILGIFIFPIIISVPYIPTQFRAPLMYIGISLVLLSLVFRIIRSFQLAIKIKLSIFYLILYLCTLEILPILIIGKIVSNI